MDDFLSKQVEFITWLEEEVIIIKLCCPKYLQHILCKIHTMRFFPRLPVFLLHRWKYKLSDNNAILILKITVLSQKLIIFYGLVNKYCCLFLSLSRHMCRKHKHYQHGLQWENVRCEDQEILQTLLEKGLMEREI